LVKQLGREASQRKGSLALFCHMASYFPLPGQPSTLGFAGTSQKSQKNTPEIRLEPSHRLALALDETLLHVISG